MLFSSLCIWHIAQAPQNDNATQSPHAEPCKVEREKETSVIKCKNNQFTFIESIIFTNKEDKILMCMLKTYHWHINGNVSIKQSRSVQLISIVFTFVLNWPVGKAIGTSIVNVEKYCNSVYLYSSNGSNSCPHDNRTPGDTVRHTAALPRPGGHGTDCAGQTEEAHETCRINNHNHAHRVFLCLALSSLSLSVSLCPSDET